MPDEDKPHLHIVGEEDPFLKYELLEDAKEHIWLNYAESILWGQFLVEHPNLPVEEVFKQWWEEVGD